MLPVGFMSPPPDFKYADVYRKGRPVHSEWDAFSLRHPPMPAAKWAKIFKSFDALKGFGDLISERAAESERAGTDDP